MGNSVEYISYTCILFSYSREGRAESGSIASLFFQKGGNEDRANFSSQYHREFHS